MGNEYFSSAETQFLQLNLLETAEEKVQRGTASFPVCAYLCDFQKVIDGVYPYHWHHELQLTVAVENPLLVMLNGETVVLQPGQGILINTKVLHSIHVAKRLPCMRKDIIFEPVILFGSMDSVFYTDYVGKFMNCRGLAYVLFNDEWGQKQLDLFDRAFALLQEQPYGFEYKVRELLTGICFSVCEKYAAALETPYARYDQRESRVRTMIRFIYENYVQDITIRQIAGAANISERECFRCFQEVLKQSPTVFLQRHRITIAERLLIETDQSIAEISLLCGLQSSSYFTQLFRETVHCTPGEYRKKYAK